MSPLPCPQAQAGSQRNALGIPAGCHYGLGVLLALGREGVYIKSGMGTRDREARGVGQASQMAPRTPAGADHSLPSPPLPPTGQAPHADRQARHGPATPPCSALTAESLPRHP